MFVGLFYDITLIYEFLTRQACIQIA